MTKLTRQEAVVLALEEGSNGVGVDLPGCLEELTGKEFVFQIRVTPINFTLNHRTFNVSTINEDVAIENHVKEHDVNILPSSEVEVRLLASSSGPSGLGDKINEISTAAGALPETPTGQNKRKRPP
ncbi:Uncharacterized protein Rs2_08785 [Raphanus sativus]|nr:Uncharacterized protein Rs2_08785 [Raphanus sativus]